MRLLKLLCVGLFVSAPAFAEGDTRAEDGFWKWFTKNEERLADAAKREPTAPMNEISDKLAHDMGKALVAELALDDRPGKKNTVVVSADGNRELFDLVKRVTARAPKLKRWDVVAFRQRRPLEETVVMEGHSYGPNDFFFRELGRSNGKIDLVVMLRGTTVADLAVAAHSRAIHQVAYVMLDQAIGEYDMETKVQGIEFAPLPAAPGKDVKPFSALPAAIDSL